MKTLKIRSFTKILNHKIDKNKVDIYQSEASSFLDFADNAYKFLEISYPKFHKMDKLSKLAFLASEVLLKGNELKIDKNKIGLILSNQHSSTDTDLKYYEQLQNVAASPALFVYTLPNIPIGEICIRNGFKGESNFFVSDAFDIDFQVSYVRELMLNDTLDACICGWVDLIQEEHTAVIFLVTKEEGTDLQDFNIENIENIYNN